MGSIAPLGFVFKIDYEGPLSLINNVVPNVVIPAMKLGAAKAALQVQDIMRSELNRLIYSTPESPNYTRTWTLYRSTYAGRPGQDHSRDHDAAKSGVDLASHDVGRGGGFVVVKDFTAAIDVGSYANYAEHVHEGRGLGHRIPKPFAVKASEEAGPLLEREIGQALAAALAAILK